MACQTPDTIIYDDNDVVVADVPPPTISGGTLLVTADQVRAVAADSDRDLIWVVNLQTGAFERSIALEQFDEPGRLVEDASGLVHVVLRRAGAIATVNAVTGEVVRRTNVCGAPRGIAFDSVKSQIHVACANGQLVTFDSSTFNVVRTVQLDNDLRDVLVVGEFLVVSRFRSPEVLSVNAEGVVVSRAKPEVATTSDFSGDGSGGAPAVHFSPTVAWRTILTPAGQIAMVHQRGKDEEIDTEIPGGYGSEGCGSIVHGAVTTFDIDSEGNLTTYGAALSRLPSVLPVDIAVNPLANGSGNVGDFAVAVAGDRKVVTLSDVDTQIPADTACSNEGTHLGVAPIAVAYWEGQIIAQTRQPPAIQLLSSDVRIALPGEGVRDTGHDLFHSPPVFAGTKPNVPEEEIQVIPNAIACASCHPEGGDDAHVWNFINFGPRRSQTLRGGILQTAPLHWDGDMAGLDTIMNEVFVTRMGGAEQGEPRIRAMENWVDQIPAPASMRSPDDEAALRGKLIFRERGGGLFRLSQRSDVHKQSKRRRG
ncbi:MAG: cytochrome-c peroxidase [Polyangiaceae bacterium]|nr:cytochrome-c peroxidase [Polyangiaceae bacterium]